ncbi:hypothetical protein SKAU_G00220280 [Synaphobranchus kaupii]|uniref:Uncharacterized protein n=1 Tax=Synaphobranchus kaupii TaxID=118154 RepID=A0A9Q1FAM9_SYNKA|nr:hypothetical protein SKAU_G00220280 [Synaphobranchus kaupii]
MAGSHHRGGVVHKECKNAAHWANVKGHLPSQQGLRGVLGVDVDPPPGDAVEPQADMNASEGSKRTAGPPQVTGTGNEEHFTGISELPKKRCAVLSGRCVSAHEGRLVTVTQRRQLLCERPPGKTAQCDSYTSFKRHQTHPGPQGRSSERRRYRNQKNTGMNEEARFKIP